MTFRFFFLKKKIKLASIKSLFADACFWNAKMILKIRVSWGGGRGVERRKKKGRKVSSVIGAGKKKKGTTYINPKKIRTTYYFSFHIKSDEKYTKIENNYSRRHGRYGGSGREGFSSSRIALFFPRFFSSSLLPSYLAAEHCSMWGLFRASSTRWSSTPSTTTSLTQPTKPVL